MDKKHTAPSFLTMKLVTMLIVLGISTSIFLTVFSDLSTHPAVSVIERLYYCITGIISISVIWNLVQNQSEMLRHQLDLGNMVRRAKLKEDKP